MRPEDTAMASGEIELNETLRDFFAAQIDIPWSYANAMAREKYGQFPTAQQICDCRAEIRYIEADCMLKARDQ